MRMISDFHSHILPGVDDGSKSVAESLAMLEEEAKQKVKYIVATPHFYADLDTLERFLERRRRGAVKLMAALEERTDLPKVALGAEVAYFRGISEIPQIRQLAIQGTNYILVEMPVAQWTDTMYRELENLYRLQGLTPIVAHVDRYLTRFRDFGIPQKLEELPVLVQANASFFNSKSTRKKALRMLSRNQIHLLGSDCHNMKSRRPNLQEAAGIISQELGEDGIRHILSHEKLVFTSAKG